MVANYTRNMNQVATYWAPGVNDGFGGLDFSGVQPEVIRCRWQDIAELFRSSDGREIMSTSIVYPEKPLALRGYLALGNFLDSSGPDPREVSSAKEIRQVGTSPSLSANVQLTKVWL